MIRRKNWRLYGIKVLFPTIVVVLGLACGGSKTTYQTQQQPARHPAPAYSAPPPAPAYTPYQTAQAAQPAPARQTTPTQHTAKAELDQLDVAIREISNYFNSKLTKGNKLVILNVQSDFPALSQYIIDELSANTVNDQIFSIVDRKQLDAIRSELQFQMSGEVDDNSAQKAGQMLGAQIIITGAVSKFGDVYRLVIRALNVETARIDGQVNKNIPNGPMIAALAQSSAPGQGAAPTAPVARTPAQAASPPVPATSTPAPAPAANWANVETLKSLDKINEYLATVESRPNSPAPLKVAMSLGNMINPNSGWHNLLTAIEEAKKFVALDLSACTMVGSTFDPRVGFDRRSQYSKAGWNAGAAYIVEIVLPDLATSISGLNMDDYFARMRGYHNNIVTPFRYFTNLRKVEGNVTNIGEGAFYSNTRLISASFPEVTRIVYEAFDECNNLTSVTLGAMTEINFSEKTYFPGDLRNVYFQHPEGQRAGTYTRTQGSDKWTKKR
jgi:hypothetical protein